MVEGFADSVVDSLEKEDELTEKKMQPSAAI
jgi:hypothetical protein